jgi:hypothetical protein
MDAMADVADQGLQGSLLQNENGWSRELLSLRDPDDVHLAALALKEGVPVWSNDQDFEDLRGVKVFSTAELLTVLGIWSFVKEAVGRLRRLVDVETGEVCGIIVAKHAITVSTLIMKHIGKPVNARLRVYEFPKVQQRIVWDVNVASDIADG